MLKQPHCTGIFLNISIAGLNVFKKVAVDTEVCVVVNWYCSSRGLSTRTLLKVNDVHEAARTN